MLLRSMVDDSHSSRTIPADRPVVAGPNPSGCLTQNSAYTTLDPGLPSGARVVPILSVGDEANDDTSKNSLMVEKD